MYPSRENTSPTYYFPGEMVAGRGRNKIACPTRAGLRNRSCVTRGRVPWYQQMLFGRIYKATVREARVPRVPNRKRLCRIRVHGRDRPLAALVVGGNDKTSTRGVLGGMFLKLTPRARRHTHTIKKQLLNLPAPSSALRHLSSSPVARGPAKV